MSDYVQRNDSYDGVTFGLAVALIAAPWVLGYSSNEAATASSLVAGLAIAACAIIALTEYTRLFEEVDATLGLVTIAAPWAFGFSHIRVAVLTHVAIGGLISLISAGELVLLRRSPPQGP